VGEVKGGFHGPTPENHYLSQAAMTNTNSDSFACDTKHSCDDVPKMALHLCNLPSKHTELQSNHEREIRQNSTEKICQNT
jgi:hypothetical protein